MEYTQETMLKSNTVKQLRQGPVKLGVLKLKQGPVKGSTKVKARLKLFNTHTKH